MKTSKQAKVGLRDSTQETLIFFLLNKQKRTIGKKNDFIRVYEINN